jgi:DtxR family Mn-dependent transcriptional regulator
VTRGDDAKVPSRELTGQAEDYLKAVYELGRAGDSRADSPVGTTAIAERLGIAAASVTGMLQRLARLGLVTTERYHGTRLTASGRTMALQLIRRHRVIESYLVSRLGFAWDDVHDEAERLEHAASPELIAKMADVLGNPTVDPHGAPIPTADGTIEERELESLASLATGVNARVAGMGDRDPSLLRYLAERGIRPGARVRVESREPFDGAIVLTVGRERQTVSPGAASHVRVETATASAAPEASSRATPRPAPSRRRRSAGS